MTTAPHAAGWSINRNRARPPRSRQRSQASWNVFSLWDDEETPGLWDGEVALELLNAVGLWDDEETAGLPDTVGLLDLVGVAKVPNGNSYISLASVTSLNGDGCGAYFQNGFSCLSQPGWRLRTGRRGNRSLHLARRPSCATLFITITCTLGGWSGLPTESRWPNPNNWLRHSYLSQNGYGQSIKHEWHHQSIELDE